MASYRMALQELDFIAEGNSIPMEVFGIVRPAPEHDIDTFYSDAIVKHWTASPSVKGKTADLIIEDELWDCPYCGAGNYVKVGHCHHCASPRRFAE